MFDFFRSRTGPLTFSFNGNLVHSSYNPLKEAEKYVISNLKPSINGNQLFIILNPGLNYIYDILEKKFPESRFIIIHSIEQAYKNISFKYKDNASVWYPGCSNMNLESFLKSEFTEINLKGLQIFNWSPGSKVFNDISDYIENTLSRVIREYNGNINTTNLFRKTLF